MVLIKPYGFVYLTFNKINYSCYIGKCEYRPNNIWKTYLGSGVYLKHAINKYGKENFDRIILKESYSKQELESSEEYYIEFFNAVESERFYNLKKTAIGGDTFTYNPNKEQIRLKKSKNSAGKNNAIFEKEMTDETKHLMSLKKSKAIIVDNIEYQNTLVYATQFNINETTVYYRLKSKSFPNYRYKNEHSLASKKGTTIEIDGVVYQSYVQASLILDLDETLIKRRCKDKDYSNYKIIKQLNMNKKKPLFAKGMKFSSLNEAVNKINRSKSYILFRVNSEEFEDYYFI